MKPQDFLNKLRGIKLSKPSKMPGFSFGLPAQVCNVGSKLHNVCGSVCEDCYALKGRYEMRNVMERRELNLELVAWDAFVDAFVEHYKRKRAAARAQRARYDWFRWHDSGDLQSEEHLRKVVAIAEALPDVRFWLPTKEYGLVARYLAAGNALPSNLTVRVSGAMVDGPAPNIQGLPTSTVTSDKSAATCPAYKQGGECLECRACWNAEVSNVCYPKH